MRKPRHPQTLQATHTATLPANGLQCHTPPETYPPITHVFCTGGTLHTAPTVYASPERFSVHTLYRQTNCPATACAPVLPGRKKSRLLLPLLRKSSRRSLSLHIFGKIVQSYMALFTTPPPLGWRVRSLRAMHSCTLRPTGLIYLCPILLLVAPHFL